MPLRNRGDSAGAAYDKYRIAEVLVQTGDLKAAEERYREAIKEQPEGDAAEVRLRLGALLNDAGRPAEGEKEAAGAEETLRVQGLADLALLARIVVIDCQRAQGKLKEAKAGLEKIMPLVAASKDNRVKQAGLLAQAGVASAAPEPGAAAGISRDLDRERLLANKSGRVIDEFDLQLAIYQLQKAMAAPGARANLTKLAGAARRKGLEGIAKKAERAVG